jgi:2-polyprenyl-3-methyl-5-hydroxy-6-metoxy-1,4-benzoquinol methylase
MIFTSEKFYTLFASSYHDYSFNKKGYLSAVNKFIQEEVLSPKSMIDVGTGNGRRGRHIGDLLGIEKITLVDNSKGMIALAEKIHGVDVIFADISDPKFKTERKYDLVSFLWNVLGHIPSENRITALTNLVKLANDSKQIFIDVNNRYNISHYGFFAVVKNLLKDIFSSNKINGDFNLKVMTADGEIETTVHIFNPFEIEKLIKSAGLKIEKKRIINYRSGKICKTFWGGQLVYKLSKK